MIRAAIVLGLALVAACGDLAGLGGATPALATIQIETAGAFSAVEEPGADPPALRVALVWGAQWLTEPLCILPPEDASAAALIAAGCRDPFGFVPARVAASVPLVPDGTASLSLLALPAADVMVGAVTARVAYGSLVIYDDRDGDGTLTLGRAYQLAGREDGPPDEGGITTEDRVYAASFVSMTEADRRLAFREGGFDPATAFYPRSGCGDPPPGFSIVAAGGFTATEAIAAQLRGELPQEDPARCETASTDEPVVLTYRAPAELHELACEERRNDSSIRYREPLGDAPDLTNRTLACVGIPDFGTGAANGARQLAVSGRADDSCVGLTHYVLRGCSENPLCAVPDWDITATPPSWWPCPQDAR